MAYEFYEFFAGGGMARLGLGPEWACIFANDIDTKKAASYRAYFGNDSHLVVDDIANITTSHLRGRADLAWASFPCQDLSLAGDGAGLAGGRSGTFWPFMHLMQDLRSENRAPRIVILENVYGAITSNGGRDLVSICDALVSTGYKFGPLVIDASLFLPQSRPRLFIVAVDGAIQVPEGVLSNGPTAAWHPDSLGAVYDLCPVSVRQKWLWWNPPVPDQRHLAGTDWFEENPIGVEWHSPFETRKLLSMMTPINLAKVNEAMSSGGRKIGALYRRTRKEADGVKRQRAEVRFDNVVGCIRTPVGGSSRQTILVVEGEHIRSRLLSPREAARLMGLPESYPLPQKYNEAYHLVGDGVAVPVVRHLAEHIVHPLVAIHESGKETVAGGEGYVASTAV